MTQTSNSTNAYEQQIPTAPYAPTDAYGHPQGADGELEQRLKALDLEFLHDVPVHLTDEMVGQIMNLLKEHHKPQPVGDEVDLCKGCNTMKHLSAEGLCGRCTGRTTVRLLSPDDGELRQKVTCLVGACIHRNTDDCCYETRYDEDFAGGLEQVEAILNLIAAQTDAAQRELLERLERHVHTYTVTEVDGIDYTDGYGSHITAVTKTAIDHELQHLKSQESGK